MSALVTSPVMPANSAKTAARRQTSLANTKLDAALERARCCLLSLQHEDGHWCGELQGDTILESEYVLLMAFLGREKDDKVRKAANYIMTQRRPDGGAWANHPGGQVDVSVSVKAYFALKIAGHSADAPHMKQARDAILKLGGAVKCNSFTKFYLAALGQYPYESCASVPPELLFLPRWAYVDIYSMSSWTRTIIVPLSLFYAHKPVRTLDPSQGIVELFVESPSKAAWPHPPTNRLFTWTNFFLAVDQTIKFVESWGPQFIRKKAVEKATQWMIEHFDDSDGVGAIFPPIIYTIISLHCLGHASDTPEMTYALKQLDDLMIEENDTLRLQPCFSPVWDTALSVNALALSREGEAPAEPRTSKSAGAPRLGRSLALPDQAIVDATMWLLDREVRRPGDWSLINPGVEPGGWYFEYRNGFYPDTDDTAMVLMALARSGVAGEGSNTIPAVQRGVHWLLKMQNTDGGWAAFDRDINHEILTKVPFADHNAMLDPSCPDITARVIEALGQFGISADHPQVKRGLDFIARTQDKRGCWIGRWGVNYIYGTWQVLLGLEAVGYDMTQPMVQRAVAWLKQAQQPNGGWGETCQSYDDPSLAGTGEVTASQTAWALAGLIAAGEAKSDAVRRGIQYLLDTQDPDGNWTEAPFTGTGFPKVFYLKYHMYRLYFPIMALARYKQATAVESVNYAWSPCEKA
jgi:squalene-hopene/tetraprenyl-beta-curcumene cyclase